MSSACATEDTKKAVPARIHRTETAEGFRKNMRKTRQISDQFKRTGIPAVRSPMCMMSCNVS